MTFSSTRRWLKRARESGVKTFRQAEVLGFIVDRDPGENTTLTEIAAHFELSPASIQTAVETLVHAGLVEEVPKEHTHDQRIQPLRATKEGRLLFRQ